MSSRGTLGARDFSCAVSGFGQAFISAFGRKVILLRARKTSGTQGTVEADVATKLKS